MSNHLVTYTVESLLTDIFLAEANLTSKFWVEKIEKEKPVREDNELVQTSKRWRCPPKTGVKTNKMTSKTRQSKKKIMVEMNNNIIRFYYRC